MHRLVPLFLAAGALTLAGCNRHEDSPKPIASADTTSTAPADGAAATPGAQGQTVTASADTAGGNVGSNAATTSGTGTTGVGSVGNDTTGTAMTTSGTGTTSTGADTSSTSGTAAAGDNAAMGKQVYEKTCIACHGAGVAGAPKFGDKTAWAPRIAKGKATLYDHAIHGFQGSSGMMPPRGGSTDTDAQLKAAVDYMVSQAK